MSPQLFTAEDIRRLAHERADTLVLGRGDIITPEAVDVAHAVGVRVIHARDSAAAVGADAPPAAAALPPLKVVRGAGASLDPFTEGAQTPGANVRLKDVVVAQDRSPMGAGYMALDRGEMKWTLTYDEIDIVLEGELVITRGAEQVRGSAGDTIYIPKGSSITFGTPSRTRFVYVVFPVNWNEK